MDYPTFGIVVKPLFFLDLPKAWRTKKTPWGVQKHATTTFVFHTVSAAHPDETVVIIGSPNQQH